MRACLALLTMLFALVSSASAQPPTQPAKPAPLAAVPTDAFMFLTVNVGKLWDTPNAKPLRDWLAAQKVGPGEELFGIAFGDIERLTLFMPTGADLRSMPLLVLTTKKAYNEAKVLKALEAEGAPGGRAVRTRNRAFPSVVLADERTLLFLPDGLGDLAQAVLLGQLIAKKTDGPLATALAEAGKHDIAFGLDARGLRGLLRLENRKAAPYLALFKARTVSFTADFDKTARGTLKVEFADAADAKRAAPVLKEAIAELTEQFGKQVEPLGKKDGADRVLLESAIAILKAAKVDADGANVVATADVPYADAVAKFVAALPKEYSSAVSSARGQNNFKQLALAMHNYESTMQVFPGDVYPLGGNNPLAWSWRVQILPYIEQDQLYTKLDFTKAWDDPANLKKLEAIEMPKVFEIPGRPAPKGHTYCRIFSLPKNAKGTERPWLIEGQKGPTVNAITDGTSNTFMIVEAGDAVPWYKPDVLAYDGKLPVPQLGDKDSDRFLVSMGDGSVRIMRRSKLNEKTLRALITPQGGEVIELP